MRSHLLFSGLVVFSALPLVGRSNPMEQILSGEQKRQVGDRWFSVSFARDVATTLWEIAGGTPRMEAVHIGIDRTNLHRKMRKYGIARH